MGANPQCGSASPLQVMCQMQESGHTPDSVSFNILIDACGKAQELDRAFEFYRQMRALGLQAKDRAIIMPRIVMCFRVMA